MEPQELPETVKKALAERLPDLSINKVNLTDWKWTYDYEESEDHFFTWEEALVDFIAWQARIIRELEDERDLS